MDHHDSRLRTPCDALLALDQHREENLLAVRGG
jgi:hypothetical protein